MNPYTSERLLLERHEAIVREAELRARLLPGNDRSPGINSWVAGRLRAGRVGINVHAITDFSMPGGGYKQSGWGRENGPAAIDPYLEVKAVFTSLAH